MSRQQNIKEMKDCIYVTVFDLLPTYNLLSIAINHRDIYAVDVIAKTDNVLLNLFQLSFECSCMYSKLFIQLKSATLNSCVSVCTCYCMCAYKHMDVCPSKAMMLFWRCGLCLCLL